MVVVDNSESSRNGDYQPTRFDAQSDAVSTLFQTITNGNPESSVGLMSMGGKGPEVLTTLTTEHGKVLDGLHRTKKKLGGTSHLKTGIQVATVSRIYGDQSMMLPAHAQLLCTIEVTNKHPFTSSHSSTDRTDPSDSE